MGDRMGHQLSGWEAGMGWLSLSREWNGGGESLDGDWKGVAIGRKTWTGCSVSLDGGVNSGTDI